MSHKLASLVGAFVFLILACASLYRLLVGFAVTIGGMQIGQTMTFFAFVICIAISLILFRGAMAKG